MQASTFCRSLRPQYATIAGAGTHYVTCGRGPAVVLIHGLSASFWCWWRTIPALANHFQIIAYDLKGCGNSEKCAGDYGPQASSEHLLALLDHLGIHEAALVAHSMGTRIALQTALTTPQRVRQLVLVNPSCYTQTVGRPVGLLVLPGIGELYTRAMFTGPTDKLVRRALRFCMHPSVAVTAEEVYWNMRSGASEQHMLARSYLRYGRHMLFHKPWPMIERFGEINAPTLVIGGEQDPFVPVEHVQRLGQALPHARTEVWPFTRHLPFAEHPERFHSTVQAFLQRKPQPGDRLPRSMATAPTR